jgi:biopolymer transport protein ExbD
MTDLVFLLLVFFMLSSAFMVEPGIKINLPKAKTAEISPERNLLVTIVGPGKIYIGDKPVSMNNFQSELQLALFGRRDRTVVIKADKKVEYGIVVNILDIIRQSGAEHLAIAAEKSE